MNVFLWSVGATAVVSIVSFIGIVALLIKEKTLSKILVFLVAFSAGALMGGAFLHLIPESLEKQNNENVFVFVLIGFSLFFVLEKFIKWRHCHKKEGECEVHTFSYMNLVGDGLHNFIDGLVIAAAFSINIKLGITTSLIVISHEIPQEISDFGVLVYGGFSKMRALFFNFLSALTAVLGAIVGYFIYLKAESFSHFLLALTAGGFIYISASDLIPELHREKRFLKSAVSFSCFIFGIALMYLFKIFFE